MKKFSMLFVILFMTACNKSDTSVHEEIVTPVETTLLVSGDRIRYHQVPAVLIAENRANLAFQLSGTVNQVYVKVGENVDKNQALMSLYNPNIDPELATNLAQLESIKIQILQAQKDLSNLKKLRRNNSASKNAYDQQETRLKDLTAKKKGIQAQIDLALANQSESIIKAPYNATVVAINKQVGEFVAIGLTALMVVQQENLEVEINLTHELWNNLSLGKTVMGKYNDQQLDFIVTEMAQSADPISHLMKVILHLQTVVKNGIGQQIYLSIPETYQQVYQLPLEVVVDDGINHPYIFTVIDQMANKQVINPLYVENGQIVFKTDKEITAEVVVKGQAKISQGMLLQAQQ
jgi:RND family efflux transporter MFP subunit